jgi:outer membrane protein assembly factor BamB
MSFMRTPILACLFAIACSDANLNAEDWPHLRGPRYDGVVPATNFLKAWPSDGPPKLWSREVGAGFSSFAIVGNRLYTGGTKDKQQTVICLDTITGAVFWERPFEPEMTDPDPNLHGPRATPAVSNNRVYMMGSHARVFCFDAATGETVWEHELHGKPHWGYSGSVLIDGNLAIFSAGGKDGSLRALDKATGDLVWTCGEDPAGYATPYPFDFDGKRYICGFMAESVLIAERDTGRLVLRIAWPSHSGVNVAGPIFHEGRLLISSGYGYGAALFKVRKDGDNLAAEELWKSLKLRNKFQTPLMIDGKIYTCDETGLKCVDFLTGKVEWFKRRIVHGPMLAVGCYLFLLRESGELQLAEASSGGFEPISSAHIFEGNTRSLWQTVTKQRQGERCWTVPVFQDGLLFARDHTTVVCLDLRIEGAATVGTGNAP